MLFTHLIMQKPRLDFIKAGYNEIGTATQYDGIFFNIRELEVFLICIYQKILTGNIKECISLFPIPIIQKRVSLYVMKRSY
jgi:hypothetical protein